MNQISSILSRFIQDRNFMDTLRDQNFNLLVTFAKVSNVNSQNLSLIATVLKVSDDLTIQDLQPLQLFDYEKYNGTLRELPTIRVVIIDWVFEEGEESEEYINTKRLVRFSIEKISLLKMFNFDKVRLLEIFDFKDKLFNYEVKTLFVFKNIIWSNVVLWFKLNNIIISGGSNSKRHILSSNHLKLMSCVLNYYNINIDELSKYAADSVKDTENLAPYYSKKLYEVSTNTLLENKNIFKDNIIISTLFKVNFIIRNLIYYHGTVSNLIKDVEQGERSLAKKESELENLNYIEKRAEIALNPKHKKLTAKLKIKDNKEFAKQAFRQKIVNKQLQIDNLTKDLTINKKLLAEATENLKVYCLKSDLQLDKFINEPLLAKKSHKTPFGLNSIQKRGFHQNLNIQSQDNLERSKVNTYFSFLQDIENLFKDKSLSVEDIQKIIENNWIDIMKNKIKDKNLVGSKLVSTVKHVTETLQLYYKNNKNKSKELLSKFDDSITQDNFIYIALSLLLTYYDKMSVTSIAYIIGKNILYNYYKFQINNTKNNLSYSEFKTKLGLDNNSIVKLGDIFITFFLRAPNPMFDRYFNYKYEDNEESIIGYIRLDPEFVAEIKQDFIPHPSTLPMVCEPLEWSQAQYGGHLENNIQKESVITGSNYHNHKTENLNILYKTINYMSKTKFGINNELLDFLLNDGCYLLNLDLSLENNISLDLQRSISIKVAKTFAKIPFYLPLKADWRGRLYTQSFFLSYQASDFTLSLLQFWEGETLTPKGREFLYIYGATLYNENHKISKESFQNRIVWVEKNKSKILKMEPSFISKAESKFVFAAFCLEMRKLETDPLTKINFPIFLDATCSGIQHLATLLKDVDLASEVNLIPKESFSIEDKVQDFYALVTKLVQSKFKELSTTDTNYIKLSNLNITRDFLKTSLMTKTYNVTLFGIIRQLKSKLPKVTINKETFYNIKNINGSVININHKDITNIAKVVNKILFDEFISLKNIYDYFLAVSKILVNAGIPLTWITPSGLVLTQNYLLSKITKTSISVGGKSKTLVLREWTSRVDKRKQTQAIIPNIIHSLDSAHIHKLIQKAISIKFSPIITIHDCFGTLPNKVEMLEFLVKSEFISLYLTENFLDKFHERFVNALKDNQIDVKKGIKNGENYSFVKINNKKFIVPEKPAAGKLDLNLIFKSKYMIS